MARFRNLTVAITQGVEWRIRLPQIQCFVIPLGSSTSHAKIPRVMPVTTLEQDFGLRCAELFIYLAELPEEFEGFWGRLWRYQVDSSTTRPPIELTRRIIHLTQDASTQV